ncbi:MFS transporter [Micromonospora cremea]|uniref:Predicted arabinose efflux permease, MFS family n=1 Tax=Micromonospora cremea TaxID=709881 RepID=A0A1N5W6M0_9ACTN|nr:MFS transporter [Micromonospora cremea]SIM80834.1 Predicted arabinose efflux permease, MFS family [Micromonospora cremea]
MSNADGAMARSSSTSGAVRVAFAFWITLVGTTVPTPLYPLYEMEFGFSSLTVTVVYAVYALGVVVGLLVFGRLADQIGRRPVILTALVLSVAADAVFLAAVDLAMIVVGRLLAGLSAALVIGAATAALAELISPRHPRRAATVAIFANLGGLATGTMLSGIVSDVAPDPLRLPWAIVLALAVIAIIAMVGVPETVAQRSPMTLRLQRLRIPQEIRGDFVRSAITAGTGFAALGVLTAVSGLFLGMVLHETSHTLAALVVFLAFAGAAFGQLLTRVLSSRAALASACWGLIVAAGLLAYSMWMAVLATLIIGALINGVASGVAVGDGIATITMKTAPQRQAEAVSTYFAILFTMLGLPAIGVGLLIQVVGLRPAGEVFSAVVAVLAVVVLLSLVRNGRAHPEPRTAG